MIKLSFQIRIVYIEYFSVEQKDVRRILIVIYISIDNSFLRITDVGPITHTEKLTRFFSLPKRNKTTPPQKSKQKTKKKYLYPKKGSYLHFFLFKFF